MVRKFTTAIALLFCAAAFAAAPATRPAEGATAQSLDDLRRIEQRVRQVLDTAIPATVGVSVGDGRGSGVIISPDGFVLTAGHVAQKPSERVRLQLADGRVVSAVTLGVGRDEDEGMMRIVDTAGPFPCVPLGDSSSLERGQLVVATGHPGGWRKDRPAVVRVGRVVDTSANFIRTDCTLIGGDSGGPLFDLDGKLVGIHSRIAGSVAYNLHVPIDTFKTGWQRLATGESWGRDRDKNWRIIPKLPDMPTPKVAIGVLIDDADGECRVESVSDDSGASKAGLREGDVILRVTRARVRTRGDVLISLMRFKPGDRVSIQYRRDGETLTAEVTLGEP